MLLWERGGNRSKKQCWEQEASTNIHIHTGIPYSSRLSQYSIRYVWGMVILDHIVLYHVMFEQSSHCEGPAPNAVDACEHFPAKCRKQISQSQPWQRRPARSVEKENSNCIKLALLPMEGWQLWKVLIRKFIVMSHQMPWECTCLNHIQASVLHREQGVCIPSVCLGSSQMRALCNICNKILTQPVTPHSDSTVL